MGTKAGVMPLHSWLPRAHPIAPAPVSALDERRDDQGRRLRPRARARRLARCSAAVVRRARARAWRAVGGRRCRVRALPARPQAACLRSTRSRTSGSSCSGWARVCSCAPAAPTSGLRSRWRPPCCTRSTTPCSSRCSSSAPARSSGRSARSSSTGSAGSCAACRGPAAPSWSAHSRSPACRRSTASRPSG